ncbi:MULTISPECIES: cytochrome c oxidase assembly protein [unclassified Pannonibacter]|uniref:cytochrome c oxidase assembly protein n=1 Tax=unclassified Pannonibacter TaxID=2627228 RepID=UPI001644FB78|nr:MULTISPECIES: cytochrome c oxidase assembly protein [unclassified Pannonibacter]
MDTAATGPSIPYCGEAPSPATFLSSWNLDPVLIAALLAALVAGGKAAVNRPAFLLAWSVLVLAFVSPLCALTSALFSARALHHLLLVSVAAPLLGLALPLRGIAVPAALGMTGAALVLWHVPVVYTAAWDSPAVYWLMQAALLIPAAAFWSGVFDWREQDAGALLSNALMTGALAGIMGLTGAVLTFAAEPLYLEHLPVTLMWGLEPLADQQAAGLIMWVPGLLPLALAAAVMARRAWAQGLAA